MARRTRSRRAENAGDFAGPDANKEAIETLAKAAAKENAKAGHNSGELPDEVYERNIMLIKAAQADLDTLLTEVAAKRGVLANRRKVAKKDGCDVDAIMLGLKLEKRTSQGGTGPLVDEHRNVGRVLKLLNVPLYHQFGLFNLDATRGADAGSPKVDAGLQGQHAGRNGEPAENNPFTPGSEDFTAWAEGWTDGQAMLADGIGKGGSGAAAH